MNRITWVAALLAVAMAGCAKMERSAAPAADKPVVSVSGTRISVDPEPLRFTRASGNNITIIWRIADGQPFRFAGANGIRIDGEQVAGGVRREQTEIVECRVTGNGKQFLCLNRNTRPGTYKYTINLETSEGKALPPFDPQIINSF
jgi:hypothetical protein